MTNDHLDVGVGTGWYLDRCRFPSADPRIALLDLNASSLEAAARRIARYRQLMDRSWAAERLMHAYNAKGIFSNAHDGLDDLRAALEARFAEVEIEVVGSGALFSARQPRAA